MLNRIMQLLARCGSSESVLPPTELYNEGWMLRLMLDWFERNRSLVHEFAFLPEARWHSEALLASRFLPEKRGDNRAESYTHADGLIGHFSILPGERGEAILLSDARQFIVIEAKLGSSLSSGVKNVPTYDQAARNVACMAHMIDVAKLEPKSIERLGFYVVAPQTQIEAGIFGDLVSKTSIHRKVRERIAQYGGSRDAWFGETFEPLIEHICLGILSWESILAFLPTDKEAHDLREFYSCCKKFNPQRGVRTV